MIWGCHSFEGGKLHAIFSSHGSNSLLEARLTIIWKAITNKGIVGYVYSKEHGVSKSIERELEFLSNYGIVHGILNNDTHLYMLEFASLRKIAREGETPQQVVRRLIEEHRLMANGQKDYTKLQKLNGEYMNSCKESAKVLTEIQNEVRILTELK